jgi:putative flippase GtrA
VKPVDSREVVPRTLWKDIKEFTRAFDATTTRQAGLDSPSRSAAGAAGSDVALATPRWIWPLKFVKFCIIGALSVAFYVAVYLVLRDLWPPALANMGALFLSVLFNTEANRRWTFDRTGVRRVGMHLRAIALITLTYACTTGAVVALHAFDPQAGRLTEVIVLVTADLLMVVVRFIALDRWVFRRRERRKASLWTRSI